MARRAPPPMNNTRNPAIRIRKGRDFRVGLVDLVNRGMRHFTYRNSVTLTNFQALGSAFHRLRMANNAGNRGVCAAGASIQRVDGVVNLINAQSLIRTAMVVHHKPV